MANPWTQRGADHILRRAAERESAMYLVGRSQPRGHISLRPPLVRRILDVPFPGRATWPPRHGTHAGLAAVSAIAVLSRAADLFGLVYAPVPRVILLLVVVVALGVGLSRLWVIESWRRAPPSR